MQKETKAASPKDTLIGIVLLAVIVIAIYYGCSSSGSKEVAISPKEQRAKQIEKQFNAWDGSHIKLKEYIKENLNDPDSYENVKTLYFDMDSVIVVNQTYTAKNGFGGRVKGFTKAKVDIEGNILEIMQAD